LLNIRKHLMSKGLGVLVRARSHQIAVTGAVSFCGLQAVCRFGGAAPGGGSKTGFMVDKHRASGWHNWIFGRRPLLLLGRQVT
jgi:hypothetical protein